MPQLLNALRVLLLIPLSLKSYLFHMHKPLPTIPHSLHHHPLPSAREIHLFKDLFVQSTAHLPCTKKKFKKQNMVPFLFFRHRNEHPSPHSSLTASFFNYFCV